MKEVERLVQDRGADPELSRLFRAGRAPAPLPPAAFQRSRRRVVGLLAAPAGLGLVVWVQHAALGAALGASVAVVAAWPRLRAQHEPTAPPSATAPPSKAAPRARPEPLRTTPPPSAAPEPSAASKSVRIGESHSSTPENPLARETALLEGARAALESRPLVSLKLLAEHEREFSSGTLALEREFLAVVALLRIGQRENAESRARSLRERAPGSLYERRLDRLFGDGAEP